MVEIARAARQVTELLHGATLFSFRMDGGGWSLGFDTAKQPNGLYLLAQELLSDGPEVPVKELLRITSDFPNAVDAEDAVTAFMISVARGQEIVDVSLTQDADLVLTFSDGIALSAKGAVPIVDWMWCISEFDADPYRETFVVACFTSGELLIR